MPEKRKYDTTPVRVGTLVHGLAAMCAAAEGRMVKSYVERAIVEAAKKSVKDMEAQPGFKRANDDITRALKTFMRNAA